MATDDEVFSVAYVVACVPNSPNPHPHHVLWGTRHRRKLECNIKLILDGKLLYLSLCFFYLPHSLPL